MQIQLNNAEVTEALIEYFKTKIRSTDTDDFQAEVGEDGTATIYINEDPSGDDNTTGGETDSAQVKPKRTRRTKAQIEADRLAEEAAKQNQTAQAQEQQIVGDAQPDPVVGSGADPKPEEPKTDAQTEVSTQAAQVAEVQAQAEPAAQEPVAQVQEEAPVRKSLFGNLRQPTN